MSTKKGNKPIPLRGKGVNKITYDGKGDTLSILLSKKQIAYGEEHGGVIVNFDAKDKPVEIEILNASKFMGDLLSVMKAKAGGEQLEVTA